MTSIAKCCCGNLSVEIKGKPLVNAVCHCDDCKRRTGSAFGLSVYVNDKQIINTVGQTENYKIKGNISQERYFCSNCGTTLFWKISSYPELTGIAGGCFTGSNTLEPEYTFTNENKCDWLVLPATWKTTITPEAFQ